MNKQVIVAVTAVGLLGAFALAAWIYQGQRAEEFEGIAKESPSILEPAHAMTQGAEDARVTIVEFFDPACETCAALARPVHQLMQAHAGRVRLVLRYAPFHPGSDGVVKMLEAARNQDKYWETLDLMFASQSLWASHHQPKPELLWQLLPRAGVDVNKLRSDVGSAALDALVRQDVADARTLGVRKTPTYFVNGKPLPSFGFTQLRELVESEIAANY